MFAEWTVECGAEDPVLVAPWSSEDGTLHFVDLRENPYDLDQIPEADLHPALMQALRALNANRSPVFTAKCDAWEMEAEELEATRVNLDLALGEYASGFASYIDLLWRERMVFVSFHQQEQRLQRLVRLLGGQQLPYAAVECVLRPALVDLAVPFGRTQEGFAVSLYVKAIGTDPSHAYELWAATLEAVVAVLRGREFSSA